MITLHCQPADAAATEVRIGLGLRRQLRELIGPRPAFALRDREACANFPELSWPGPGLDLDGGEAVKTLGSCEIVLRALVGAGLDRRGLLIAIGGGAIGDLGGLSGSLFLRGIDVWQVPTTLLAMTDAAVGGKTAVNLPEGKNLVGTVWPARLVLIDPECTATLPELAFRSGLAEAVKMAIGLDADLFALLERQRDRVLARDLGVLTEVITRSVRGKIDVVAGDLRETGPRRVLNLGHTLGHALEARAGGALPHGLCVARGLHFALDLAELHRAIDPDAADRCRRLLLAYGYRREPLPPAADLLPFLRRDKKVEGGRVHFVLPAGIGRCSVQPLDLELVASALVAP